MVMEQLINKLKAKRWFGSSSLEIQNALTECKYVEFLNTINNIDDENDFGEIIKMTDYWTTNKISGVCFEIRNKLTNQMVQSEFICWNQGNNPLGRGVILVTENEKVTKIILEKKYNLVTYNNQVKSFSMSFPDYSDNKVIKLPQRIAEAVGQHTVIKYIDLGEIYSEDSLINGKTALFALILQVDNIDNFDSSKISVIDIKDEEQLSHINDGYLQSIISRLKYEKII